MSAHPRDGLTFERPRGAAVRDRVLEWPQDGAFDRITELATSVFQVPIALITIVDEEGIWFKSRPGGVDGLSDVPREPGLCASVMCRDDVYAVGSAKYDPRTLNDPLVAHAAGFQFFAAAPLTTHDGHTLGTICIIDRKPRDMRRRVELQTLETLASIVTDALEARLVNVQIMDMERDIHKRVADTLQRALLPALLDSHCNVEIDATYKSASTDHVVGGDWYDAFEVGEHELLLSIGDVQGHGLGAAVTMGQLRLSLRSLALKDRSPRALLADLNTLLLREDPNGLVTAFVGILNTQTGRMIYSGAGHPPPLLRSAGGNVTTLDVGGMLLGLRTNEEPEDSVIVLNRGDLVVLYTDGLTEATRDSIAGEECVRQRLTAPDMSRDLSPAHTLSADCLPSGSHDDAAILTMRFLGGSSNGKANVARHRDSPMPSRRSICR